MPPEKTNNIYTLTEQQNGGTRDSRCFFRVSRPSEKYCQFCEKQLRCARAAKLKVMFSPGTRHRLLWFVFVLRACV